MKKTGISPQTAVILENIEIVQKLTQYLNSGILEHDILSLLSGFERRLPNLFPAFSFELIKLHKKDYELRITPNAQWQFSNICISFFFSGLIDRTFGNRHDNPSVALVIERSESEISTIIKNIKPLLPLDWKAVPDSDEYLQTYALFKTINIGKYAKDTKFNTDAFYKEAEESIRVILIKPQIDRVINECLLNQQASR